MYTVNALMHQTMLPVELYDMNSSQMEEPLFYYFKIDLRTPIGKPVVVRRYKSPEIKLFSKVKNRGAPTSTRCHVCHIFYIILAMAKGSQLLQLKAALSQAGITGNSSSSKKRKRASTPLEKEKKAVRLEEIHRRLNSFDVKVTKTKHDVSGRKVKGISGTPAQSKQAGIEQVSQHQVLNIICDLKCFSARKRCSKSGNYAIVQVE